MKISERDAKIAEDLAEFYADPLGHVMYSYPWTTDKSIQIVELPEQYRERFDSRYGPDLWACQFLDRLGKEIEERGFDGQNAVDPIAFATVSGHGIGKSTLVAWLIKFIMDTRPFAKGVVTANTADQLRTKTWAEVAKWHAISVTADWFEVNSGRNSMAMVHKQFKEEWKVNALPWREEKSEAFAGLHAANSTPFYIFDEASGISDKIFEVREGGTTDGEPMLFDFGNGTKNTGRFFEECEGRHKDRFIVTTIDSRAVAITNKKLLNKWVEEYGEDSDFVRVRVRGMFPQQGDTQFIPSDIVSDAGTREAVAAHGAPLVIGVDVARFGNDESVIYPRIGNDARSFPPKRFRGLSIDQLVDRVIDEVNRFRAVGRDYDAICVDGTGQGAGVVDFLRRAGYGKVFDVQFGGKPSDPMKYRFKVDEMYGKLKDALGKQLAIPSRGTEGGEMLYEQLTQRLFGYMLNGAINLESKSDMKERLGSNSSPDVSDALALTYAVDVVAQGFQGLNQRNRVLSDYDPLEAAF